MTEFDLRQACFMNALTYYVTLAQSRGKAAFDDSARIIILAKEIEEYVTKGEAP